MAPDRTNTAPALLEIRDLKVDLMTVRGIVYALDGVDLTVGAGEIHGVVGESGCGKSMTAKSILRLHNERRCRTSGEILFEGRDLNRLSRREMEQVRGKRISMIFQDPMVSLNPLLCVGEQIAETIRQHEGCSKDAARRRTLQLLSQVGITPPEKRYGQFPFELSGGLQQRVMIAIAIACNPALLIADEPTTALDVTIQAQVLELLKRLSGEMAMSILLITHNFGIVAEVCDRVSVMYAGRVVETADARAIFRNPCHPYTRGLIDSIPRPGARGEALHTIPGAPPQLYERSDACPYMARCPHASAACNARPEAVEVEPGHIVSCHIAAIHIVKGGAVHG